MWNKEYHHVIEIVIQDKTFHLAAGSKDEEKAWFKDLCKAVFGNANRNSIVQVCLLTFITYFSCPCLIYLKVHALVFLFPLLLTSVIFRFFQVLDKPSELDFGYHSLDRTSLDGNTDSPRTLHTCLLYTSPSPRDS